METIVHSYSEEAGADATIDGTRWQSIKPGSRFWPDVQAWKDAGNEWPEPEPPVEVPVVTVLYPVDLWSRLTDVEADQVEATMATQTVRLQNIFKSASSYRSDHELWPLLQQIATGLFGAQRAGEILKGSENA